MADVRRSGRATKGQHNKSRDDDDESAPKVKGAAKKGGKKESEAEEEDEIIRCVCGHYEEEEDEPRTMICCDMCLSWQHNDCMLLPDDYAPSKYFCEQCKPQNHKKVLDLMKRGEKPWEEVARKREAAQAEKATRKKGKKGRKSGGRLSEAARTPTVEPDEQAFSKKRKFEDSPVPDTSNKRSRSTARGVKAETPSMQAKEEVDSAFGDVAQDVKNIADPSRKRTATALVKSFVEQAETAIQSGTIEEPEELSAQKLGTRIALRVEHAIYHVRSGGAGEPNQAYKDQLRAILNNIKTNPDLLVRLVNSDLSAEDFAAMDSKDMATNELKQKDADTKIALEKQHTIVEEDIPRIRKTHK
ncbi:Transcription factor bye1, partial [Elasticomyces elasticus]